MVGRLRSIDVGSEESAMQFSCSVHLRSIQKKPSIFTCSCFVFSTSAARHSDFLDHETGGDGWCLLVPGMGLSGCALRNDTEIEERAFLAVQLAKFRFLHLKRMSLKFSVIVEIHRSLHGANNSPQSMDFFDGKIGCVVVEFAFVVVCGAWAECSRPGKL